MDEFLALVGVQAMRYAIRSSIALASTYAVGQLSHYVKSPDDFKVYSTLRVLHNRLEAKIKIISPAIDLIELKSERGNVFLEAAAPMAKALQRDITALSSRIERKFSSLALLPDRKAQSIMRDLMITIGDLEELLSRIDREIPLLQLAISASGETLSTSLPASISPSRLLQASTLLTVGDIQFSRDLTQDVQIGPTFSLSLYMLFRGHAPRASVDGKAAHPQAKLDPQAPYGLGPNDRKPMWQEVVHKARVRLLRRALTLCHVYEYSIEILMDKDDGRFHNDDDAAVAPAKSSLTYWNTLLVREISKLFYTDKGRILNLGHEDETDNNPVLLLKRDCPHKSEEQAENPDVNGFDEQADVDRQLLDELHDAHSPVTADTASAPGPFDGASHLDPEWLAFEMFEDDNCVSEDVESQSLASGVEDEAPVQDTDSQTSNQADLSTKIEELALKSSTQMFHPELGSEKLNEPATTTSSPLGAITSSLSLLEMLIRLASLQEFQQTSHLSIPDHILTFFLEEASSTGLMGTLQSEARVEAKNKVGFDPYTDGQG